MARATFVKQARKPNPVVTQADIDKAKAGAEEAASYFWWKFRFGGKRFSKTRPRASQLTQSEYYSTVYGLQEDMEDARPADLDELRGMQEEWAGRARDLGDECRGRWENMPDSLRNSETGCLLEERADAMEAWADELEGADLTMDAGGDEAERLPEALDELLAVEPEIA